MKTFLSLVVILVTISSTAFAQTAVKEQYAINQKEVLKEKKTGQLFDVQVLQDNDSEKFILIVNNPFQEKLNVSIKSNMGDGFNEFTTALTYRKRFDMKAAEDGNYVITVGTGKHYTSKKIRLNTQVVRNIEVE